MNKDNTPQGSPPLQLQPAPDKNKKWYESLFESIQKYYHPIYLLLAAVVTAFFWLDTQFDEVNEKFHNLKFDTSTELNDKTALILDKVGDNTEKISVLTERVSNIQEDVEVIRDRVDSGFDRTSFEH